MLVRFAASRPEGSHALAIPVASGAALSERLPGFPASTRALILKAAEAGRFEGDAGALLDLFVPEGEDGARRLLLVGVGSNGDYERAGGALAAKLLISGETSLVIDMAGASPASAQAGAQIAHGAVLRSWRHDVYRTKLGPKARPTLAEIIVTGAGPGAEAAWERLSAIAEGVAFTRSLVAEPANILYPESFVERCRPLAELGVEIEVLDEDAMRAAGMGALLGVSQGSERPARLLALRWDGTGGTQEPTAFVGKGVTFDTGGISIKPAGGMEDMKWDMGGAGAVVGAITLIALRKAKAHVIGVCGLVENMPGGKAQRPGDIVTTMSGQTVEVINTDAEGRLVLCDALTWVQRKYKPRTIVDLATLTGAMIIALGHEHGGLFSNSDELADQLLAAGKASGDPLWRLPMGEAYDKLLESPIADMKNVGPRDAGSISAAQFLLRFIDDGVRWAHLDIAGMVWAAKPGPLWDKGATGYGVRLIERFVADTLER
jgi:leucyl aminopeptidase